MAGIRSLKSISDKWGTLTPQRADEYRKGVQDPKKDWATEATKAKDTWKQALTQAMQRDAYSKGIEKVGTSKWKKGATMKGPGRFAEGVQIAQPDYERGFAKFHDIISKTELPPRYPTGDPRNLERTKVMSQALRQGKIQG